MSTTNERFVVGGYFVFFFSLSSFKKCILILFEVLIPILNLLWLFCFFSFLFSFKKCILIFFIVLISVLNLLVSNFFSSSFYKSFFLLNLVIQLQFVIYYFFNSILIFFLDPFVKVLFSILSFNQRFFLIWSSFFFFTFFFC